MNSPIPQSAADFAILPTDTIEDLVSGHFENVFAFFDVFFQDPKAAIHHTENAFVTAKEKEDYSLGSLYRWVVERVSTMPAAAPPRGLSHPMTACFMLKEIGKFRYTEIAEIMRISLEEVKNNIASARRTLISEMA